MHTAKLPIKDFSKFKPFIGQPDLNEIQLRSYELFLKEGLRELFKEVSPIRDHTGKELELYFEDSGRKRVSKIERPVIIRHQLQHA